MQAYLDVKYLYVKYLHVKYLCVNYLRVKYLLHEQYMLIYKHTRIRRIRVGSIGMVTRLLLLSVEFMQRCHVTTLVRAQTKQYQMNIWWVLWTYFLEVTILFADFPFFCATKYSACACYFDSRKSCFTLNYARHKMVTNSGRVLRVHFLVLNNRIEVVIPVSLHFVQIMSGPESRMF